MKTLWFIIWLVLLLINFFVGGKGYLILGTLMVISIILLTLYAGRDLEKEK